MREIDEAMRLIELIPGDHVIIRRQLELVAKAARREALNDAADQCAGDPTHRTGSGLEAEAWRLARTLRRMAEETI